MIVKCKAKKSKFDNLTKIDDEIRISWVDVNWKWEVKIEWMENEKNGKLRKIILIKSRKGGMNWNWWLLFRVV